MERINETILFRTGVYFMSSRSSARGTALRVVPVPRFGAAQSFSNPDWTLFQSSARHGEPRRRFDRQPGPPVIGLSSAPVLERAAAAAEHRQFGALPWRVGRKGKVEVLLVTSRRRGRWIIPKGWPIKGRTPAQTAAREAFEEAGVVEQTSTRPIGGYNYMKMQDDGSVEKCHVTLFGLQVRGTLVNWPERKQRKRCWRRLDAAVRMIDEPELARLVDALGFDTAALA